ncbi:sarcosine oxidase subunit gamma [Actinoplanes subtropicus]|uniref:sarcosine oxidase subunit gamma n=1 Tax=Actinoplanes subtropicus TaxID=543632 RepID=UPI0004C4418C|nr:sarcosine oxidase subunit gamma family protein [Actinoplanes subtropicus]
MTVEQSPLAAFAHEGGDVRIAEIPFLTQLDLRLDPDGPAFPAVAKALGGELPTAPCTASRLGDVDALWLGPDEWLLLAEPGRQRELEVLLRAAIGEEHGAVVDVSAQRTALSLAGPAAREVLARGCSIDLDPRFAPAGTCVQTLLARTGVTIVVQEERFLLLVRASFAQYLAAWLVDSTDGAGR